MTVADLSKRESVKMVAASATSRWFFRLVDTAFGRDPMSIQPDAGGLPFSPVVCPVRALEFERARARMAEGRGHESGDVLVSVQCGEAFRTESLLQFRVESFRQLRICL
jgi:hypothetical protein